MNVGESGPLKGNSQSQEVDLNLAPIIDCLTVLIIFILASASYLAIGILETNLAVEGAAPPNTKPPAIRLDIELNIKKEISIRVSGKGKLTKSIAPESDNWNRKELVSQIQQIKKQWPDTQQAVLSATDDVPYKDVVAMMETLRPELPSILLGGL